MSHYSQQWSNFCGSYVQYDGDPRSNRQLLAQYAPVIAAVQRRFPDLDVIAKRHTLRLVFNALNAVRCPTTDTTSPQFGADVELLGDALIETDELVDVLEWCGLDDTDDWFDEAEDRGYYRCADGVFAHEDRTFICERHQERYSDNAFSHEVVVGRSGGANQYQTWSEDAVNNYAFYCSESKEYYDCTEFCSGSTSNGDDICTEWAQRNGWYWHEGPEYWATYAPDEDDADDEDDEDGRDRMIPDYHDAYRNWTERLALANRSTRAFYGLEIEVEFNSWDERRYFYEKWIHSTDCSEVCAERDGSLSDSRGLEIITRPYSLDELRSPDCYLRKVLAAAAKTAGDTDIAEDYGIHVNTNWGRLSNEHQKRVRDFVFNLQVLSQYVAGRGNTEYSSYSDYYRDNPGEHYSAVHRRDGNNDYLPLGRAGEFRIFRSTVKYDRLLSYVEFVDAITEWTRDPARPIAGAMASSLFRHWVCLTGQYPSLSARFPTPSAKELHPCVLPSSNRQIEACRKNSSATASTTTPTAQASRTSSETLVMEVLDDLLAGTGVTGTMTANTASTQQWMSVIVNTPLRVPNHFYTLTNG